MFCRSLFVLFFFWPLCCLSFFELRIMITSLVSSNSSHTVKLDIFIFEYIFLIALHIVNKYTELTPRLTKHSGAGYTFCRSIWTDRKFGDIFKCFLSICCCVGWTEIITIKTLIGQVYCSFFFSRPLKVINSNQRLFTYMHRKDSLHSTCSMMWNQNCNLFMRLLLKLCEGWHFHYMCKTLLDLNIFFLILFVRFYLKKKTRKITLCTSHSIDRPNRKINWKQC